MKNEWVLLFKILFLNCILFSQPLNQKLFVYKLDQVLQETGSKWDNTSSIGNIKINFRNSNYEQKLFLKNYYTLSINNNNLVLHNTSYSKFNFFYFYYDLGLTKYFNKPSKYGSTKDIFTMNNSGFGIRNDWVNKVK